MNIQLKGLLITTIGVLCVVPDALFIRLIDVSPLIITFWRGLIAGGLILLGTLLLQGPGPILAMLRTGRRGAVYMGAVGVSGLLFATAVSLTSVANVVFIIAAMPVFAALQSRLFLGEPISRRMMATMAVVFCGIAVIAWGSGENQGASLAGDLVALLVAAIFAGGLTAARSLRQISMVPGVGIAYVTTSCILLLFIDPFAIPAERVHLVPMHGLIITASSVFLALGPRYITSAEVALLVLLESVLAPVLVWAVIGEDPGPWALFGGAIVLGALVVSNLVALRRQKAR